MIRWAHPDQDGDLYAEIIRFIGTRVWGEDALAPGGTAAGIFRNQAMVAGVAFHNWQPDFGTVELSCAGSGNWLTRGILSEVMGYAYGALKAQAVIMTMAHDNMAARSLCSKMGSKEYIIPRLMGRDKSMVIGVITSESWNATGLERNGHG